MDLVTPRGRFEVARNIARLMLTTGTDVVLGPAVDLANSDGDTGKITTQEEKGVFGFYVEAEKRRSFSLSAHLPSIRQLYRKRNREFKSAIIYAELALPFSGQNLKGAN